MSTLIAINKPKIISLNVDDTITYDPTKISKHLTFILSVADKILEITSVLVLNIFQISWRNFNCCFLILLSDEVLKFIKYLNTKKTKGS